MWIHVFFKAEAEHKWQFAILEMWKCLAQKLKSGRTELISIAAVLYHPTSETDL